MADRRADARYRPARAALRWYDGHRRDFPWRAAPRAVADPYHVWLAEMMLQQTTTAAAKPYFEKFVSRWPSVLALAAAERGVILEAWAGLGYYRRAHHLHQCATVIARDYGGVFPKSEEALRQLPGVGAYSAAAIAAIAFGERAAAIDANIERVLSRLYRFRGSRAELLAIAREVLPRVRVGDYTQALMDIGSGICRFRSPLCLACPFVRRCLARAEGDQDSLPVRVGRKSRRRLYGAAFVMVRGDGAIFLRRREDGGLLGGMMEVPMSAWRGDAGFDFLGDAPIEADWVLLGGIRHSFTHIDLGLGVYVAGVSGDLSGLMGDRDARWVALDCLGGEALPSLVRKVLAVLGDSR